MTLKETMYSQHPAFKSVNEKSQSKISGKLFFLCSTVFE